MFLLFSYRGPKNSLRMYFVQSREGRTGSQSRRNRRIQNSVVGYLMAEYMPILHYYTAKNASQDFLSYRSSTRYCHRPLYSISVSLFSPSSSVCARLSLQQSRLHASSAFLALRSRLPFGVWTFSGMILPPCLRSPPLLAPSAVLWP